MSSPFYKYRAGLATLPLNDKVVYWDCDSRIACHASFINSIRKMKKISYAAAGAICAVLIFVFLILPRMEPVEAATDVPNYELVESYNPNCPGPCNTYVVCTGSCDEDEGEECCDPGAPGNQGSCMFC